jgi:hypothetical protein
VVFGLIAVAGARIWVQNRVDLSQNSNLIMVAVTLVLGAGDFALSLGGFTLGGIGTATFGVIYHALLNRRAREAQQPDVTPVKPQRAIKTAPWMPHGEEDVAGARKRKATLKTVSRMDQL